MVGLYTLLVLSFENKLITGFVNSIFELQECNFGSAMMILLLAPLTWIFIPFQRPNLSAYLSISTLKSRTYPCVQQELSSSPTSSLSFLLSSSSTVWYPSIAHGRHPISCTSPTWPTWALHWKVKIKCLGIWIGNGNMVLKDIHGHLASLCG